jgi:hypothetical protein
MNDTRYASERYVEEIKELESRMNEAEENKYAIMRTGIIYGREKKNA